MQPSNNKRYHGSKRASVFGVALVFVILVVLAVIFVEIVAVVAICAILIAWLLVYNGTLAFLRITRGPKLFAVDGIGLWRGRGTKMTLLVPWNELRSWQSFQVGVGGAMVGSCEFQTPRRRLFVSHEDVEVPSPAEFAADVRRHAPMEPENRPTR